MKLIKILFLFSLTFILACGSDTPDGWNEMSLLQYGLPITLIAPDSADVKTMDLGLMKDVSVKKGDDFYVQITMSEATSIDVSALVADQLDAEKGRRNFLRIVQEDPAGFIVERSIDSTRNTFDFRYVSVKGEHQFLFQTGLSGFYSLEEVERMYKSVQQ
ncbi:MAG: hypothetical protein KDC34_04380 [Saprospiraceae bacterium]|nr:hypothetical protein [Saprospiraceae bacterium]